MVITEQRPLVLGSGSPRRREILSGLGIPLRVVVGSVDETPRAGEPPPAYLDRIVRGKLAGALDKIDEPSAVPAVLVADTIVIVDGDILGKPRDEAEAVTLLGRI